MKIIYAPDDPKTPQYSQLTGQRIKTGRAEKNFDGSWREPDQIDPDPRRNDGKERWWRDPAPVRNPLPPLYHHIHAIHAFGAHDRPNFSIALNYNAPRIFVSVSFGTYYLWTSTNDKDAQVPANALSHDRQAGENEFSLTLPQYAENRYIYAAVPGQDPMLEAIRQGSFDLNFADAFEQVGTVTENNLTWRVRRTALLVPGFAGTTWRFQYG